MKYSSLFIICLSFVSCKKEAEPQPASDSFSILNIEVDGKQTGYYFNNVSRTPTIVLSFNDRLNRTTVDVNSFKINGASQSISTTVSFTHGDSTLTFQPETPLNYYTVYTISISTTVTSTHGQPIKNSVAIKLLTELDLSDKFPILSDSMLLDLAQKQTLKYFYDYAEPGSGMARERNGSNEVVTSGGSGFGLMALIVGMERKFISRSDGVARLDKILTFLEDADRFHGAWSHWINGTTGKVIPFSIKDNGGDLVETSFLVQGLLTFRQYLDPNDATESELIERINVLWKGVEWDWYRRDNQNVLYWHWSPSYNWDMNFPLYGYFEEQITYILAAASPTHSIPKEVYTNGYGKNGAIKTDKVFYGYTLPLGDPAPLFWVQYSYLGMDPHFSDDYANYWQQNVNATMINYSYCVANPKKYVGYGENCWGLTASDIENGYGAQSPTNDIGVITPTAALSSFPYTPDESMKALKFFYYKLGDRLWGNYGFYDAFNISEGWAADSYLAIDQGPIIVMIENYRTGLLWKLFMSAPEIKDAQAKLGFTN